jgi:homopolymeric O-antigen transport system permease protein
MVEYEIRASKKIGLGIKELIYYKELFYFFTWRDIKVKYKQTVLGFAWAILQPLFMMLIFTLFFGRALKVPSDDIPYPVFVYSGLLLWNIFSSGVTNAGNSMVTNANIIKKIYFPRLIIPLSSVLVSLFDFIMAFVVFIGIILYYQFEPNYIMLLICFPAGILITVMATFGIGTFLASLNVKYRDFRYVIPFMVQSLLFISPVIYPASVISNKMLGLLFAVNPMTGAISLFRIPFTGVVPPYEVIIISSLSAVFFLVFGLYHFRKTESYFADLA